MTVNGVESVSINIDAHVKIYSFFIMTMVSFVCSAQKKPIKSFETEFSFGISLPLDKYRGGENLVV